MEIKEDILLSHHYFVSLFLFVANLLDSGLTNHNPYYMHRNITLAIYAAHFIFFYKASSSSFLPSQTNAFLILLLMNPGLESGECEQRHPRMMCRDKHFSLQHQPHHPLPIIHLSSLPSSRREKNLLESSKIQKLQYI